MKHSEALTIAQWALEKLKPHCHRIEIAGSIRREKPEVKDIELVAIPKPYENNGLFVTGIAEVMNEWEAVKSGSKYTQRILPQGIKLDLFFSSEFNWGWIFALRTGSAEFNFKYLDYMKQIGLRSHEGEIKDHNGNSFPLLEETDFFNLIKMPYIHPKDRI